MWWDRKAIKEVQEIWKLMVEAAIVTHVEAHKFRSFSCLRPYTLSGLNGGAIIRRFNVSINIFFCVAWLCCLSRRANLSRLNRKWTSTSGWALRAIAPKKELRWSMISLMAVISFGLLIRLLCKQQQLILKCLSLFRLINVNLCASYSRSAGTYRAIGWND